MFPSLSLSFCLQLSLFVGNFDEKREGMPKIFEHSAKVRRGRERERETG